jgi:hypothetical protein
MVMSGLRRRNVFSPMPRTFIRSSIFLKRAVLLAGIDDPLRDGGADARQLLQFRAGGGVQVQQCRGGIAEAGVGFAGGVCGGLLVSAERSRWSFRERPIRRRAPRV